MKRVLFGLGATIAAGIAGVVAVSLAEDGGVDAGAEAEPERSDVDQAVAAGRSWRLDTANGPVHVWVPAGYHPDGAATILYAHGYYTDVDQAWVNHRLPQQFALSGANALFIAPEVPSGSRQAVHWPSLADLLVEVQGATGVARPMGATVAIGHSGAYRVMFAWMDYPGLDAIVAMDAMYDEVDTWQAWIEGSAARRLVVVGDDTVRWTEELARALADETVTLDRFPDDGHVPAQARRARIVYVRSQFGHMPLVTEGFALPYVIRLLPVELLPDAPWDEPLGLPPLDAAPPDTVAR
ncbi:MAG: hypothetical protein K8M05_24305 [Deltaproteobacteria bacterium]|nr:hypothetical protein [Kofleriaceae bacterium]